jgi:hypothetical protein
MDIRDFKSVVKRAIKDVLGERDWFSGQPDATAFAMLLTCRLACLQPTENHLLVGAPKSKQSLPLIKHFIRQLRIKPAPMELMVDFLVARCETDTRQIPITACESEVHQSFGVDYNFDKMKGKQPRNGYVWDFRKLLFFQAERRLFIARFNKPLQQLSTLKKTLQDCARDYRRFWNNSELFIVLLPSGKTQKEDFASIAVGRNADGLTFENVFP